jgi:hypothetical protein
MCQIRWQIDAVAKEWEAVLDLVASLLQLPAPLVLATSSKWSRERISD